MLKSLSSNSGYENHSKQFAAAHSVASLQQQHQKPRPLSCMSSIAASMNNNMSQTSESDMFMQRMQAMLTCDDNNGLSKSFSANHLQNMQTLCSSNNNIRQSASSLQPNPSHNVNEINVDCDGSRDVIYQNLNDELNAQIRDLSAKSALAHEKLKQLQNEHSSVLSHKQQSQIIQSNSENEPPLPQQPPSSQHTQQEMNSFTKNDANELKQREALEKLKREQQQLKEQISMLNKQRESTRHELESLAFGSLKHSHSNKNNSLQQKQQTKSSLNDNFHVERFSPIPNENIFQQVCHL
jgi:hypothetical protein